MGKGRRRNKYLGHQLCARHRARDSLCGQSLLASMISLPVRKELSLFVLGLHENNGRIKGANAQLCPEHCLDFLNASFHHLMRSVSLSPFPDKECEVQKCQHCGQDPRLQSQPAGLPPTPTPQPVTRCVTSDSSLTFLALASSFGNRSTKSTRLIGVW